MSDLKAYLAELRGDLSSSSQLAQTILDQMGGTRRLRAMLGAKDFLYDKDSVQFKFPNRLRSKPNFVKIRLAPDDTYTMEFGRTVKFELKHMKVYHGIYADQLTKVFENETGLATRL